MTPPPAGGKPPAPKKPGPGSGAAKKKPANPLATSAGPESKNPGAKKPGAKKPGGGNQGAKKQGGGKPSKVDNAITNARQRLGAGKFDNTEGMAGKVGRTAEKGKLAAQAAGGDARAIAALVLDDLRKKWHRATTIGTVLVVVVAGVMFYVIYGGSMGVLGGNVGQGENSVAAAEKNGVSSGMVSGLQARTEGTKVPWQMVAAINKTAAVEEEGAGWGGFDMKKVKKNYPGLKKAIKRDDDNYVIRWLVAQLNARVDGRPATSLALDTGAQSNGMDYRFITADNSAEYGPAAEVQQVWGEALADLPLQGNPERAETVFLLARTWALGQYLNECDFAQSVDVQAQSGWANPAAGPITSPYGMRTHPVFGVTKLHDGTDIGAKSGAPVYAASSGTAHVTASTAYGSHFVTIDHGNGVETQYGHMKSHTVSEGQQVKAGEQVGTVGTQGISTGPHLHFIVRQDGETTDPEAFMEAKGVSLGTGPAGKVVGGSTGTETVATSNGSGTGATPDHQVVAISMDGLAARALTRIGWGNLPNFNRMRENGASTLNARTMVERTLTLPNHTSMITGRPILGSNGHGVAVNHDVPGKVDDFAGTDVASMFSTAADSGFTSALLTGKSKFRLFDRTWPAINRFVLKGETQDRALTRAAVNQINRGTDLTFLHLSTADHTGHAKGWMSPAYLRGVRDLDRMLGKVLDAAGSNTTVLLTSDHGGTGRRHPNATDRSNYQIPFFAWGAGVPSGADLYELNGSRKNPGTGRPGYTGAQPVRNGDIANAAAALLGANTVPGSVVGAKNPLKVTGGDDTAGGTTVLPDTWSGTSANGEQVTLDKKQLKFARTIATVGKQAGVSDDGLVIAFMTVFVESKFRNYASTVYERTIGLEYPMGSIGSDHDSVGLFQQRPAAGWGPQVVRSPGTEEQRHADAVALIKDVVLQARNFYGGPDGPNKGSPMGLIDHTGWESRPKGEVAQDVQSSAYPDRYAVWEDAATELVKVVGTGAVEEDDECSPESTGMTGGFTVASFNVLGWGHTQGPGARKGFPPGRVRFPAAMSLLTDRGVTIAALNEMHAQNKKMFRARYSDTWGSCDGQGDMVVWRKSEWKEVSCGGVKVPYFFGQYRPQPMVLLENKSTGDKLWFMGIHNPANAHGQALQHRRTALLLEKEKIQAKAKDGTPVIVAGDFNDLRDGASSAQCILTPYMTNAFGKSPQGCARPKGDAPVDHIFARGVTLTEANVDTASQKKKISDHPLVTATIPSQDSAGSCAPDMTSPIRGLGVYAPAAVKVSDCMYGSFRDYFTSIGGYRGSSKSGNHERGCALDVMIRDWDTPQGRAGGDKIAAWGVANLKKMNIQYVIWQQKIWSLDRNSEGWRPMGDRGSPTDNHYDHVHFSVAGAQCKDE